MKVLYIDIETSPNLAYVWGLFKQNIGIKQLHTTSSIICFAAKWAGKKKMEFWSDYHDGHEEMLAVAWELLDEADVVCHYNGKQFDIPNLNREIAMAGMPPPSPFQQLDLLSVVRKNFRFTSNKLAHVSVEMGLPGKIDTDFDLWLGCMANDETSWAEMRKYNKQDVILLEQLHEKLRPWCGSVANTQLFDVGDGCPFCGSLNLIRNGFAYTQLGKFQRFVCRDCGGHSRVAKRTAGANLRPAAL